LTISSIARATFAFVLVVSSAHAQAVQPERFERDFNVLFRGGEYMNLYAMGTLDHKSQQEVASNSEATVSKYDLKAPGKAHSEYANGLRALARNDLPGAVESLKKAVGIYPKYVSALNALGHAYYQLKEYELARQQFLQAVQLDDHLSSSYLNLGRAQLALGNNPGAQTSMEKASSIAPLDGHLLMALTYAEYLNHDYQNAIKTAKRAHGQSHSDTAIVHYYAAASWQALHDLPEARNELETFLTEDPKSPFADAAQRVVGEIRKAQEQPAAPPVPAPVVTTASTESPSVAQVALQQAKALRQIAEAESEGSTLASSDVPLATGTEISKGPSLGSDVGSGSVSFRSTVNEVAVFFSATEKGKSVTDLTPQDVTLLDDHIPPAAILSFNSESDLPLRLGLLIDISGSIAQ